MIILIHGAWHGPWVWDRVKTNAMLAPQLDLAAGVGLSDHVAAIGALIATAAEPVVLVGHSYGAAVAQLAAARWPQHVSGLVGLDGFVLRPGQAIADLLPPRIRADWATQAPLVQPLSVDVMAVNQADRDWVAARLRPHPWASFSEPAPDFQDYTGPRSYLRATGFTFPPFDRIARHCAQTGWRCETIATGHDVMLAAPDQVSKLIGA